MNLSTSGMLSSFRQDVVVRQLSRSASSNGKIFDPTSSAQKSNHETDKQAEENATWFFEYKALLNSKLTTLTTALTSAYTTDLDASMTKIDHTLIAGAATTLGPFGAPSGVHGRNAMQGITGTQKDLIGGDGILDTTVIDPGAARTTNAYFKAFGFHTINEAGGLPNQQIYGAALTSNGEGIEASTASIRFNMASNGGAIRDYTLPTASPFSLLGTSTAINASVQGTTTFMSGGSSADNPLVLDRLYIDLKDNKNNNYFNIKDAFNERVTPYSTSIEGGDVNQLAAMTPAAYALLFTGPVPPQPTQADHRIKNIGNNLELTLYKFFSKPENYDLIKFGLMDELYIVGTSSLATGSQIQGSISLRYNSSNLGGVNNSYIELKQERYSCFFHS